MNPARPAIGYIGIDVLNNATVCNEATGLLEAGIPLEIVSVHRNERATFHRGESIEALRRRTSYLYPLGIGEACLALLKGPFAFGLAFWGVLLRAIFGPAEGLRQRATLAWQVIPATVLALRWRDRGLAHIHSHWAHTATGIAMHAAGLLGVGFSFTGHANDLFVHRVALKAKVRRARFIACISEFHRQLYLRLGADPARLPVVYCGIDTGRFRPATAPAAAGRPRVVSVGRLVEKKGFGDLIAACALLRDRGLDFDCLIAGSGPLEGELRARVAAYGLEGRVRVTGQTVLQEDLPGLLASAAAFALPCVRDREGDMDGLPQVLIEALACGVPAVSTRLVGIPDLIRDGRTGLLVEPGDVAALADALVAVLTDPALAARLGEAGGAWARAHFGREAAVSRLARLFRWAAATPGRTAPDFALPSAIESDVAGDPGDLPGGEPAVPLAAPGAALTCSR